MEKRFRLFDLLFMQRQKILSATPLERPFTIRSVREKIFQGSEQKRTEPAFLPINAGVNFMFDEVSEKALREILRIVHAVAAAAHKTVKRRPISLAKLGERGLRNLRFGLGFPRREDHAPMGRRKQITASMPVPCQRLHVSSLYQDRRRNASRKKNQNSLQDASKAPKKPAQGI